MLSEGAAMNSVEKFTIHKAGGMNVPMTAPDHSSGRKMSAEESAAAAACILTYIGCAGLEKEKENWANRAGEERGNKRKSRRTQKGKARSRKNSDASFAQPEVAMAAKASDAQNKRKFHHSDEQNAAGDGLDRSVGSEPPSSNPIAKMKITPWSEERCRVATENLESSCRPEQRVQLEAIIEVVRELALSRHGTWVAQTALDVARGADRDALIAAIRDHVVELYACPYGNHVLSKAIEVLPRHKITFIVSALAGQGVAVAKHRFGCRVVCRLFEHCSEEELRGLFDEFVCEAAALARHQFGNFIIQSLLEHAYPVCGRALLDKLLPHAPQLAQHRFGSLVMQRLLDFSDVEGQKQLISKLMWHPSEGHACTLVEVACTHYGSFVVEQLASMKATSHEVYVLLQTNVLLLLASEHGQRVIEAFKLSIPESA
mmetsp:Transcript_164535/g.315985  ORF Transcript_164535/g.315985 Transcript_164535/m.315985 type:complete len:430 (+) Transcript_164535:87-1376(+)